MANIACSILIRQQTNKRGSTGSLSRIGGWSEGWWFQGELSDAMDALVDISEQRAKSLVDAARVVGQRVRIVRGGSRTNSRTFPGQLDIRGDIPQMSLLCSVKGVGVANVRKFSLRGVPDARVEEGEFDNSNALLVPVRQYIERVQIDGFRFKAVNLATIAYPVLSISDAGAVVLTESATFTAGAIVQGLRVIDGDGNGISFKLPIVPGVDSKHWTLQGWTFDSATGGRIREVVDPIYPVVESASFNAIRITTHKVGADFFAFRGRASKKR